MRPKIIKFSLKLPIVFNYSFESGRENLKSKKLCMKNLS